MPLSTLTIKRSTGKGRASKTRRFSVRLLGFISADPLWESGSGDETRPVWISYLGTESESQAFTANFRGAQKAQTQSHTFKMLKSAPYRWTRQKVPGGVVTTAYLPELFHLEPAFPAPARVRFVFAPPTWWLEAQEKALEDDYGAEAREVARAALFAAYLDRRTPLPVLGDLDFHLELFRQAQKTRWVDEPKGTTYSPGPLYVKGAQTCGFDQVLAVSAPQQTIREFLIDQTSHFQPKEAPHGKDRIASDRRLLSHPQPSPATDQLRLALA